MNRIPPQFYNVNRFSSANELYKDISELFGIKSKHIQIYYKGYKIPNSKELIIPEIGYEYNDFFEYQKLDEKIKQPIVIHFGNNNKKYLKLDNKTLLKEIAKSDMKKIISKLIHTPSQNINETSFSGEFDLKKDLLLYEVKFYDFKKTSKETEYYCLAKDSPINDLQTIVAKKHHLRPNQIECYSYDKSRKFQPNKDGIFCFRYYSDSVNDQKNDSLNCILKVNVQINQKEKIFELPINSSFGDLRKKIIEKEGVNHCFGIVVENEFKSNDKKISHFIIDPDTINKVTIIFPQPDKCCDIFNFINIDKEKKTDKVKKKKIEMKNLGKRGKDENKSKPKKGKKEIKNDRKQETYSFLLPISSTEFKKVLSNVIFKKNYLKELFADDKPIKFDEIKEVDSSKIISYRNGSKSVNYIDLKGEKKEKKFKITDTMKQFLQSFDYTDTENFLCIQYNNSKIPFWKTISELSFNNRSYLQLYKINKQIPIYKIKNGKLKEKPELRDLTSTLLSKYDVFSDFIQLNKNDNIYQCYPQICNYFVVKTENHIPDFSLCNPARLEIKYDYSSKNPILNDIRMIFGISKDETINLILERTDSLDKQIYSLPLQFSKSALLNGDKIIVNYDSNQNSFVQNFKYKPKKRDHRSPNKKKATSEQKKQNFLMKSIIYDEKTTVEQILKTLQKEFGIYECPSNRILFYFGENEIKPHDMKDNPKELFKKYFINPLATIELRVPDILKDCKPVNIYQGSDYSVYYFEKNDKISDVNQRLEEQFHLRVLKITDLNKKVLEDDILDNIKVYFKQVKVTYYPFSSNDVFHFKNTTTVKKVINKYINDKYKNSKELKCGIYFPNTDIILDEKQTLSQSSCYNFYRYVSVEFVCSYLSKDKTDKDIEYNITYNENWKIGDIKYDLMPFVKDNHIIKITTPKLEDDDKKLVDLMENHNITSITVSIVDISNKSRRSKTISFNKKHIILDKKKTGSQDNIYLNGNVTDNKTHSNVGNNKDRDTDHDSDNNINNNADNDTDKNPDNDSDYNVNNNADNDTDNNPDNNSDNNVNNNAGNNTDNVADHNSGINSSNNTDSIINDNADNNTDSNINDNADNTTDSNLDNNAENDACDKEDNKVDDNADDIDKIDDNENKKDSDGLKNYKFKFPEGDCITLPLPLKFTVSQTREKIVEYLKEKNNDDEDDDFEDLEPSSIDILFAGKILRGKIILDSLNLKDEVLNIFIRKTDDIFLMTAKALRFTKEDLANAKAEEYEYEYEYEYEEESEKEDDD